MSDDFITETSEESWFSRLGNAIVGVLVGLALFVGAIMLLFWNEGRSVKRYKALKEGAGKVVSVRADKIDPANEKKLVHLTGLATTKETLSDPEFGIAVNAIKLEREVEMYQWKERKESETEKKLGGGTTTRTTYSYEKVWSKTLISSSSFKQPSGHENPKSMPYKGKMYVARNVSLGAFTLSRGLVDAIDNFEEISVNASDLPSELMKQGRVADGEYYLGKDPQNPQIGDIEIDFEIVRPTTVSIVAQQIGNTFEPYTAASGGSLQLLRIGTHSAENMFQAARSENKIMTWILRGAGFIMMLIGFAMVFRPLSVVLDVLPFLGGIAEVGTGIVAFFISVIGSSVTIAVAWFFYRPLLAGTLIAVAVGSVICIMKLTASKRRAA